MAGQSQVLARGPLRSLLLTGLLASAAGLGFSACSGTEGVAPSSNDSAPGAAQFFFGDLNEGGTASDVLLSQLTFGRLVAVDGLTSSGARQSMATDFVIDQSLVTDNLDYELTLNGITGQETLLIRRNVDDADGRAQFLNLLKQAGETLDPIQVQDLSTTGTFSMLPRNAALVLRFDDLLLPSTISDDTVQILQGDPPTSSFEARTFPSAHYGGLGSDGNFYPSRVIVDLTSSLVEQQGDNPVNANGVGLIASFSASRANVQIRIPTVVNPTIGLTQVLTNLTNQELSTMNNGPVDFDATSRPVIRAMRSGGQVGVVDDLFNGFLRDTLAPQVLGATPLFVDVSPVQVREDPADTGSLRFILPEVTIPSVLCGREELTGEDVISQAGLFAQVIKPEGLSPSELLAYVPNGAGQVFNLPVELVVFPRAWDGPSEWEQLGAIGSSLETIFQAGDSLECFVQILPRPEGFPDAPTIGVSAGSATNPTTFTLQFSEPMDPASLTAFDSVTLTRELGSATNILETNDFVVGSLTQSSTLRDVTFRPILGLAHAPGVADEYFFSLAGLGDVFPPRDLAGNSVLAIPTLSVTLEPDQGAVLNGGRVSRFTSTSEDGPGEPEWGGQIQFDLARQSIRARPVVRSQVVIDNDVQPLLAQMTEFPAGVQTPFSPLGSKMQTLWRYSDCGFSLTDSGNINIDVEGMWWAPANGSVTTDTFSEFEIRLSHSRFAPDELINPQSLFPRFQNSGLLPLFTNNVLTGETQQVVHPRERGYRIDQADVVQTSTGTTLVPFPLNRGIPDSEKRFFTWRDTRIRTREGANNGGLESEAYLAALGLGPPTDLFYRFGSIQTLGLPLLMEFRTSPELAASGQNAWVLNLAVNSSSRPFFRAFSTGGVNASGNQVFVDPGNEVRANGGFSPGGSPPGETTFNRDNTVHLGQLDYVARVSLAHSVWFESVIPGEDSTAPFTGRSYSEPTVEPSSADQPNGTSVSFSFRGATGIVLAGELEDDISGVADNFSGDAIARTFGLTDYQYDAFTLDLYGDYWNDRDQIGTGANSPIHQLSQNRDNFGLTFLPSTGDSTEWRTSVDDIADALFYQVRMTFIGNPTTGQGAEVSAFALTWGQ